MTTQTKDYRGLPMEGPIARWYAKNAVQGRQGEFEQVRMAFNLRIMPHVDPDILVKVRAIQWLLPINGR